MASITDHQQAIVAGDTGQASPATPDDGSAGNLDRVRDILFGGQMRDLDRRFARIEERLAKDAADLKDELRNRLATLEQFVRAETEALAQRIGTEHDERTEAVAAMSRDLQATSAAFDKKIAGVEDRLARAQRELRQQILDVQKQLADETRERMDGILARLNREANDLRSAKADRVTLAALFTEVAMRLTHEPAARSEQE